MLVNPQLCNNIEVTNDYNNKSTPITVQFNYVWGMQAEHRVDVILTKHVILELLEEFKDYEGHLKQ